MSQKLCPAESLKKIAMWKLPKNWWKKPPFLIVLAAVIFWSLFFTYRWADRRLESHAAETSAILYQLSSDLQNLPQPKVIKPGQTSGNAAGVITKYEETIQNLRESTKKLPPPLLPNLMFFWKSDDIARVNAEATKSLNEAADELEKTTNALKVDKKFIEYAPKADLAYIGKSGSDAEQRLERTKTGLLAAARDLRGIKYEQAPAMAGLILKLADQVPALTDKSLPAWSAKVMEAQTAHVNTLQTYWPTYIKSADDSLRKVAVLSATTSR